MSRKLSLNPLAKEDKSMTDRHFLKQALGITLSFALVGLLSVTAYAAGPTPEDGYRTIPAADHCPFITSDAAGSIFLAANPELSTACRYTTMLLKERTGTDALFPNIRPEAASFDKIEQLQSVNLTLGTVMTDSAFAAANPEVMRARHYTPVVSGLVQVTDK